MKLAERLREAFNAVEDEAPLVLGDCRDPDAAEEAAPLLAAVLVAVVDRSSPGLLLTLRTDFVRHHAGQIAFPGGRIDPDDEGPIAAALREAEEEIGLPPRLVDIVATGHSYRTVTGFDVTPVIGVVPPDLLLAPQPDEVAAIFEVPLDYLVEPQNHLLRSGEWQGRERSYYEIEWQGRRIWGATAAMIVNLSPRLALAA